MKKAMFFLLIAILMLSGCSDNDIGILNPFAGEWVVGEFFATPRPFFDDYIRDNNNITGLDLVITDDYVMFRGNKFFVDEIEICDSISLSKQYNLVYNRTAAICSDNGLNDEVSLTPESHIRLVRLIEKDEENGIYLVVRSDNSLMLWVGESYEYIGFYELIPDSEQKELANLKTNISPSQYDNYAPSISIDSVKGISIDEAINLCHTKFESSENLYSNNLRYRCIGAVEFEKKQYYVMHATNVVDDDCIHKGFYAVAADGTSIYDSHIDEYGNCYMMYRCFYKDS